MSPGQVKLTGGELSAGYGLAGTSPTSALGAHTDVIGIETQPAAHGYAVLDLVGFLAPSSLRR
jgi:hypothetical protein